VTSPVWFDTHCHLYDVEDEAANVVERARAAGVGSIVTLGVDVPTSKRCVRIAEEFHDVYAGTAYHPSETRGWHHRWIEDIEAIAESPEVVAIGETGLDLYWDDSFFDSQLRAFASHIELAKRVDKALVIHTRESMKEALEMFGRGSPPERFVFHCWSGTQDQLKEALGYGAFVSFAGNVSYKTAEDLREAARAVPEDRLLVETDSPYLAPVPHRGKPNEPAYVVSVGEAIAIARDTPIEELASLTTSNANSLFGLSP
jgi:TatD DNase family protein